MSTLANIRLRIKQRSDNEHTGSSFVSDSELDGLINKSRQELFGLLLLNGLNSVPETSYEITADGSETYDLPDDFVTAMSVYRIEGGNHIRLVRHDARHHPNTEVKGDASTYRIWGYKTDAVIQFSPIPTSGTYKVRYVAAPTDLAADGDIVDGVLGWEEYIVVDVAIDVLIKEGAPPHIINELKGQRREMVQRIEREAAMRDMSENYSIQDTRARSDELRDYMGYLPGDYRVRGYRGGIYW